MLPLDGSCKVVLGLKGTDLDPGVDIVRRNLKGMHGRVLLGFWSSRRKVSL